MAELTSCALIKSHNQNRYYYDRKLKRTLLCHPLLYYILQLHESGRDMDAWHQSLAGNSEEIEIEGAGRFSAEDARYYYQQYRMLKENGYFGSIDQEEKLSGVIDEETVRRNLANVRQLTFEVTDRCNIQCRYCGYGKFYTDYDARKNHNLDIDAAKRLLDFLLKLWNSPLNDSHNRHIYISFYGGEPLLNFPFIREVVSYVKQLDARHNIFGFTMTTNAVLLGKHMDFLREHDFNLLISLDGNEKNSGYRVFKNGKPAYKTIVENVNALRQKYPDYFLRKVNFNAVLHNKNSVSEIYNYFKKNYGKKPAIGELSTSGIDEAHKEEFWKAYSNIFESLYQSEDYWEIQQDMFVKLPGPQGVMRFLHHYQDFCYRDYNDLMCDGDCKKWIPTGTCLPFSKKVFVTVNGKILPCEKIGHQFSLGRATAEKVELDFSRVAAKFNTYYKKMKPLCSRCHNAENCVQCLFYLNIDEKRPVCKGFMNKKNYSDMMASYIGTIETGPPVYSKVLREVIIE